MSSPSWSVEYQGGHASAYFTSTWICQRRLPIAWNIRDGRPIRLWVRRSPTHLSNSAHVAAPGRKPISRHKEYTAQKISIYHPVHAQSSQEQPTASQPSTAFSTPPRCNMSAPCVIDKRLPRPRRCALFALATVEAEPMGRAAPPRRRLHVKFRQAAGTRRAWRTRRTWRTWRT